MMRFVKGLGWAMIGSGTLILLFLAYQLFFTNLLTARAQSRAETALEERFDKAREELPEAVTVVPPPTTTVEGETETDEPAVPVEEPLAFFEEPAPAENEELGRLLIPEIDLDWVMFEGVSRDTLKLGPGHMPWTPMPGQPGNAVVSGHRTTYGAPFYDLDALEPGDEIRVETVVGEHVYAVVETRVVSPSDVWVTNDRPGAWLTLTTCNPRFSARERLVIIAEMVQGPNAEYAQAVKEGLIEAVSS